MINTANQSLEKTMLNAFLLFIASFVAAFMVNLLFPKAQFRGYDVIPLFLLPACQLLTQAKRLPSFLPFGLFVFFFWVILIAVQTSLINKNISMKKMTRRIWDFLSILSLIWFLVLVLVVII